MAAKALLHGGFHAVEEGVGEVHAGDVEREADGGAGAEVFLVAGPELGGGGHGGSLLFSDRGWNWELG